eukprot:446855_1
MTQSPTSESSANNVDDGMWIFGSTNLPPSKVLVHFRSVGAAPRLKKTRFKISGKNRFHVVIGFLRKQLRFSADQTLFCYCNETFCPSSESTVSDLYECFNIGDELVVNYSVTEAWS